MSISLFPKLELVYRIKTIDRIKDNANYMYFDVQKK